jgi:hypothetical protein
MVCLASFLFFYFVGELFFSTLKQKRDICYPTAKVRTSLVLLDPTVGDDSIGRLGPRAGNSNPLGTLNSIGRKMCSTFHLIFSMYCAIRFSHMVSVTPTHRKLLQNHK